MIKINASIGFLFFTVVNIVLNECFLFQGFRFLTVLALVKHGLREGGSGVSHIFSILHQVSELFISSHLTVFCLGAPTGTFWCRAQSNQSTVTNATKNRIIVIFKSFSCRYNAKLKAHVLF